MFVTVVLAGRGLERHEPDRGDAEALQVVKPPHQAGEVTNPVPVGIHIRGDRQAVDYRVLIPQIVDHRAGSHGNLLTTGEDWPGSVAGRKGWHVHSFAMA